MATNHALSNAGGTLARVLTTDFCPWANRFVYWLKEPVGWFALAILTSVMIGLWVSPIGFTIAASLAVVSCVGMIWPWVAVRAADCSLRPGCQRVHEDDLCHLSMLVRNRLPMPLWGLAVEGFLDRDGSDTIGESIPTVALAYVRAWSTCRYRFSIQPSLRGRYPNTSTSVVCSFPFGIWTARRRLEDVSPITVWPKVFPILGCLEQSGRHRTTVGEGDHRGGNGDFIGVREHRIGDSAKQVNWTATARCHRLIVTERGAPDSPAWEIIVDDRGERSRDEIADQIRVAASLLASLHRQSIAMRVHVGTRCLVVRRGPDGFAQMMDLLADVPANGSANARSLSRRQQQASISISTNTDHDVTVCLANPETHHRLGGRDLHHVIGRNDSIDIAKQLESFWSWERRREHIA
ncbi:MAG: DUF58 domain-containing protein [Planctomycetota bacterium]